MQKPSLPRGTRDFGPLISSRRKFITDTIEDHFLIFGFNKLETPALENLSVLTGKYGDEGDQLLFKVLNSGDFLKKTNEEDFREGSKGLLPKIAEKGLRYDLTVPFARFVAMNQHETTMPFKRYQIQPVWRADRPARGRYREFYQCDADIIGSKSLWNEAELSLLIHEVMSSLKIKNFELKVNHREILFAMAEYVGMKGAEIPFCTELDKLDKIGPGSVIESLRELGGAEKQIREILDIAVNEGTPAEILSFLQGKIQGGQKGFDELHEYFQLVQDLHPNNQIQLDLSLARGLSYYTGVIFEVKPTGVVMGSICGGGRYDDLTGVFGLPGVSGVGISFGLDRIYDVMEQLDLFPTEQNHLKILITHLEEEGFKHGMKLLGSLRKSGVSADIYPEKAKLKKQISYANKISVPFVITVGENEIKTEKYAFKDMKHGTQQELSLQEIIGSVK